MLQPKPFLQILLTIFIGILVASFIGLGIATFYPAPVSPSYPVQTNPPVPVSTLQNKQNQVTASMAETDYETVQQIYQKNIDTYNVTVSSLALILAVLIVLVSFTILKELFIITDGVLLGGLFTLAYSIIRSLESNVTTFRFLIVSASLVIILFLTYFKFVKPAEEQKS